MSFKRLDPEDISISAESIVSPAWSSNAIELTDVGGDVGFHLNTNQVTSNAGSFFYHVYHKATPSNPTARIQFAIAYGHKDGLGAVPYDVNESGKSASSTIYGQYRNLVFGDEESTFNFVAETSDDIYVITINRARYKEKLMPGTFNLKLDSGSGGPVLHLTDNSNDITTVSYVDAGRVYEIISGSNGSKYAGSENGYNAAGGSYGKFLPDVGVILLSGKALDAQGGVGGLNIQTQDVIDGSQKDNMQKLFNVVSLGNSFKLQSEETISSNFIFVRVRNSEFNYSTNPSNITSSGELTHDVMINSPQAYITTVGLYNDSNDLLGVAKLSRPLLKDFTKEALVRIKLDY